MIPSTSTNESVAFIGEGPYLGVGQSLGRFRYLCTPYSEIRHGNVLPGRTVNGFNGYRPLGPRSSSVDHYVNKGNDFTPRQVGCEDIAGFVRTSLLARPLSKRSGRQHIRSGTIRRPVADRLLA